MHRYIISLLTISIIAISPATSATRQNARNTAQMGGGTTQAVSARSATSARSAKPATSNQPPVSNARKSIKRNNGNTNATTVSARAGTTQKVVGTGTKVTTATQNTAVDATCQEKFNGCMDSFCIIENTSGGRCQCSAQNAEFAKQLEEIEKLDQQSYKLATVGVETIETGVDIAAIQSKGKTSGLDLSQWNTSQVDDKPTESTKSLTGAALQNEAASLCLERMPECASSASILRTMYAGQIRSDCAAYSNAIKEQRKAAENRLAEAQRALRSSAYDKLQSANKYDLGQCTIEFKKCMISTGGCGDDFKGCVGIAAAENAKNTKDQSSSVKQYSITGSATKISIAASSYDTLESKKPLCDSILNSCQSVRDQVWPAFLREIAPTIKTAELTAESDLRTSCISNISDCFQKACKDTMDPNNPEGSYDMCLSRPETVKSLCKVQIDPCEKAEPLILDYVYARLAAMRVDSCTNEVKQCLQSDDRCGKDYTGCVGLDTDTIIRMCPYDKLTGCQKVYTEKGIDIRGDAVYDELATMVQGLMLGIDNNLLEFCQNAANESMIRVCGDTSNCDALATDDHIGAGSLEYKICEYAFDGENASIDYSKCRTNLNQISDTELGRIDGSLTGELGPVTPFTGVLDGMMFWELVTVNDAGEITSGEEYFNLSGATETRPAKQTQIRDEIQRLQTQVSNTIHMIESDPTVQFCMTGRKVQGMKESPVSDNKVARFPQLTKQMRKLIATSALKVAKENYYKSYDIQYEQMMQDYVTISERLAAIKGENAKDARREAARKSCVSLADMASLPMSPPPPSGWGVWLVAGIVTAAAIAVCIFVPPVSAAIGAAAAKLGFVGAASVGVVGTTNTTLTATIGGIVVESTVQVAVHGVTGLTIAGAAATAGAATAVVGGISSGIAAAAASGAKDKSNTQSAAYDLTGHHELNQWNWKQTIDTTFEWDSLSCHKCVKSTKCIKQSYPLFGMPKCKQWAESTTECTDTQF